MDATLIGFLTNGGGLAIAAIALVFTAINTFDERRNSEISALFDVWNRYETYCAKSSHATPGPDQQRCALNLLNYIENICYVHNHKRANKHILENIRAIAGDFIAIASQQVDFENVLLAYKIDTASFSEIRAFCSNNRTFLSAKGFNLKGSIYETSASLSPMA